MATRLIVKFASSKSVIQGEGLSGGGAARTFYLGIEDLGIDASESATIPPIGIDFDRVNRSYVHDVMIVDCLIGVEVDAHRGSGPDPGAYYNNFTGVRVSNATTRTGSVGFSFRDGANVNLLTSCEARIVSVGVRVGGGTSYVSDSVMVLGGALEGCVDGLLIKQSRNFACLGTFLESNSTSDVTITSEAFDASILWPGLGVNASLVISDTGVRTALVTARRVYSPALQQTVLTSITVPNGTSSGSKGVTWPTAFTSTPSVQLTMTSPGALTEFPFCLFISSLGTTGCTLNIKTHSDVGAERTVWVNVMAYNAPI